MCTPEFTVCVKAMCTNSRVIAAVIPFRPPIKAVCSLHTSMRLIAATIDMDDSSSLQGCSGSILKRACKTAAALKIWPFALLRIPVRRSSFPESSANSSWILSNFSSNSGECRGSFHILSFGLLPPPSTQSSWRSSTAMGISQTVSDTHVTLNNFDSEIWMCTFLD